MAGQDGPERGPHDEQLAPAAPGSADAPAWSAPDAPYGQPPPPVPSAPPGWGPAAQTSPGWRAPPAPPGGAPAPEPPPGWAGPPAAARSYADRPGVVPLRPLGLGELLDGAVGVVRGFWRPVFAAAAVVAVLGGLLELVVVLTLVRPFLQLGPEQLEGPLSANADAFAGLLSGTALTGLFATFSALVLAGLVAPAVSRGTLAQPLTGAQAWEQLRPRLVPLAAVAALTTAAVVAAVLLGVGVTALAVAAAGPLAGLVGLLAVPAGIALAVLVYVRWALAPLCVVLERTGVRASLQRSALLVRRSWWRVLGVLLLTAVIASTVGQVLQVPFLLLRDDPLAALSGEDTSTSLYVVTTVAAVLAQTVVGPFEAAVRGLLYVDRRMRAEGLDVALAAAARR